MDKKNLRLLDIDDLIICDRLRKGSSYKDLCKLLGLTPPAISHRIRKLEATIPDFDTRCIKGNRIFSPGAVKFCESATTILEILEGHYVNTENS